MLPQNFFPIYFKIVALLAFLTVFIKKVMRKMPANANLYITIEFYYLIDKSRVGERDSEGNIIPITKTFVLT